MGDQQFRVAEKCPMWSISNGLTLVVGRLMSPLNQDPRVGRPPAFRCPPSTFVVHATVGLLTCFTLLYTICPVRTRIALSLAG
jgi:hypothetical protein